MRYTRFCHNLTLEGNFNQPLKKGDIPDQLHI